MHFENHSDITEPLQAEIDRLAEQGGGEIRIGAGDYRFRPVRLRSNICLYLEAGARLTASGERSDYSEIGYNHNEMGDVFSCFFAMDAANITLRGEGSIDLNADAWYDPANPETIPTVGPTPTPEHFDEAPRNREWRVNQPIFFHQCENLRIEGITVRNAPCWTFSFNFCRIIKVLNLTVINSLTIPNSDGMHFTGSSDILVSGCAITAGDDCVALTGITDWDRPCENAVITNCVFQSASKAISVGYMHSIVRNVLINNVIIKRSNRAFAIMSHPHTGRVENVRLSNCILEGRSYGGRWWGNGEPIIIMATPHHMPQYRDPQPADRFEVSVSNITFSNITCRAERPIGLIATHPIVQDIQLRDCTMEIVPEEKAALKGNVIDLAPGPENLEIPDGCGDIICRNVEPSLVGVTDGKGAPISFRSID